MALVAFAMADGHMDHHQGRCKNAGARYPDGDLESCAGIQLQHSGGFEPFEFIFQQKLDGVSPKFAIMLEEKGYLRQAKCPYGHFDSVDHPLFGTIIDSIITGGVSRQFLGENLRTGSSNIDVSGDWGNTTVRQRFLCPSASYIESPVHTFVCDNSQGGCPTDTAAWDGEILLEASGFENSAECASEFIGNVFEAEPIIVGSNNGLIDEVEAQPGKFGLVPVNTAQARKMQNPNLVILSDRLKCAAGYGFVTRKDDEALCHCLTEAINLVDPYDYAGVCCGFRALPYEERFGAGFGESAFDLCHAESDVVNDEGTIELPSGFTFSDCGKYFCDRPGDAACSGYH